MGTREEREMITHIFYGIQIAILAYLYLDKVNSISGGDLYLARDDPYQQARQELLIWAAIYYVLDYWQPPHF
jgi:hypothetical protein